MKPFGIWIEGHSIQATIFATPRLRVMVGANAMLGELWYAVLPALFQQQGKGWQSHPLPLPKDQPTKIPGDDPLRDDHPAHFFPKGVINQAGGHFHGVLTSEEGARTFAAAAIKRIQEQVPGLSVDVVIYPVDPDDGETSERHRRDIHKRRVAKVADRAVEDYWIASTQKPVMRSPWAQACEVSGLENAVQADPPSQGPKREERLGAGTRLKREKGFWFDQGKTGDPLCLFLREFAIAERLKNWFDSANPPAEFAELLQPAKPSPGLPMGDLAVIKIDGNNYGAAFRQWRQKQEFKRFAESAFATELFWYEARRLMRLALRQAMEQVLAAFHFAEYFAHFPIRILMLGGDDLLLVCPAELAIPLVVAFENSFREIQRKDHKKRKETRSYPVRTFSAGILIMPPTYPFHAAQDLAEQLTDSAKARSRALAGNWVDWQILTTGHSDDLQAIRQRDYWRCHSPEAGKTEGLFLTRRPYPIALAGLAPSGAQEPDSAKPIWQGPSLEGLWQRPLIANLMRQPQKEGKWRTDQDPAGQARRKIKQLRASLGQGKESAEMDFRNYIADPKNLLGMETDQLWQPIEDLPGMPDHLSLFATDLMDLIELSDLAVFWQWRTRAAAAKAPTEAAS